MSDLKKNQYPTSFNLSTIARENLETITRITGVNKTAALEMALGLLATKLEKPNDEQD
jgi:Holliday junction resolvasome RuvABC DNA-binding subunit